MEHILTFAGCTQLLLALCGSDRIATAPAVVFGIVLFTLLVRAIHQVLKENTAPTTRRRAPTRIARIV